MLSKILNFLKMIALTLVIAIMLFVVFAIVSASGAGDKCQEFHQPGQDPKNISNSSQIS